MRYSTTPWWDSVRESLGFQSDYSSMTREENFQVRREAFRVSSLHDFFQGPGKMRNDDSYEIRDAEPVSWVWAGIFGRAVHRAGLSGKIQLIQYWYERFQKTVCQIVPTELALFSNPERFSEEDEIKTYISPEHTSYMAYSNALYDEQDFDREATSYFWYPNPLRPSLLQEVMDSFPPNEEGVATFDAWVEIEAEVSSWPKISFKSQSPQDLLREGIVVIWPANGARVRA